MRHEPLEAPDLRIAARLADRRGRDAPRDRDLPAVRMAAEEPAAEVFPLRQVDRVGVVGQHDRRLVAAELAEGLRGVEIIRPQIVRPGDLQADRET